MATTKEGTATVKAVKATKKATVTVSEKVEVDGVKYTVTTIAANAFKNAPKAKTVKLPKTVTSIQKNAFKGLKKLKTVSINLSRLLRRLSLVLTPRKLLLKSTRRCLRKSLRS